MATGKSYYRFLCTDQPYRPTESGFELEESDLYTSNVSTRSESPEVHRKINSSGRVGKKSSGRVGSAPVNVPDWSKILREEYRDNSRRGVDVEDDSVDGGDMFEASGGARVPPHEFLARTRMASFSVHEGVGRTLKGRDLSRVRNAIFEKIGFQD